MCSLLTSWVPFKSDFVTVWALLVLALTARQIIWLDTSLTHTLLESRWTVLIAVGSKRGEAWLAVVHAGYLHHRARAWLTLRDHLTKPSTIRSLPTGLDRLLW